jgi:glutamate 5-kinase
MPVERTVVKFGTSTLTAGTNRLSLARIADLVRQVSVLHDHGQAITVVSSGAIAAGRETLGYPDLPKHIPKKQMLAAVGQLRLMVIYEQLFAIYEKKVAQVLLTRADLSDRRRYLNARNTIEALLEQRIIPIVNENDTVATEEIRFGDNDQLSAQVASLIEADQLVLLTDQDGLFTGDPRRNPDAELIRQVQVEEIPESYWEAAGGSISGVGTGGMFTKLKAADLARRSGVEVIIANGSAPDILLQIANQAPVGTRFYSLSSKLEGRKRFLLAGNKATGNVIVDSGAARAIRKGGSLLPVGITRAEGDFDRGDTVRISSPEGKQIAVGISSYAIKDLVSIIGRKSNEIETILGYNYGDEVVHHDNMVIL